MKETKIKEEIIMTKTIEEKEQQSFVWAATFRIKKANSNEIKHLGYSSDEESGTFIQNWLRRHIRKIENEIILSSTNIPDTIDEWIPIQLSDIHQMIQDMLAFMTIIDLYKKTDLCIKTKGEVFYNAYPERTKKILQKQIQEHYEFIIYKEDYDELNPEHLTEYKKMLDTAIAEMFFTEYQIQENINKGDTIEYSEELGI